MTNLFFYKKPSYGILTAHLMDQACLSVSFIVRLWEVFMETSHQIKKYHVVFKNKFVSDVNPKDVQRIFTTKFRVPKNSCERIFSGRRVRIKKGLSQQTALSLQDKLFKIGMLCDIELDIDQKPEPKRVTAKESIPEQTPKKTPQAQQLKDEDDEEDDDIEADFDLSEILMQADINTIDPKNTKSIIEVIKYHDDKIVDIQYLNKKDKYIDVDNHFCLAELDRKDKAYFYFDAFIQGSCYDTKQKSVDTESLRVNENMYAKNKRIYRHPVPDQGHVTLTNDVYTYHIQRKISHHEPSRKTVKPPRSIGMKHFARSVVCHLMVILLVGWFVSFEKTNISEQKRFAKIAGNKIHDLQKLRKKRQIKRRPQKIEMVQHHPKKTKAPVKEVRPANKKVKKQISKTKVSKKNIVRNHKHRKKTKMTGQSPSGKTGKQFVSRRSQKKGNGGGKVGNVATPNVNQKGLLGMIKDTGLSLLNTEALAAVTQLDTVDVPGNFEKNTLKINGVKGSLGNRKVQMPLNTGGGRVSTKGAHQVLRTGGGDGSGGKGSGSRVGELAKGNTGNHAVKAMIRASFKQSEHQIQGGGMSRTAVKKVIDQHIDDITYCYEVALISDPSIVGKAVYEWRIMMNGSVGDVRILNASIQNQEILGCIKRSIKTWTFPQPHRAQVAVSYPFVFDIVGF